MSTNLPLVTNISEEDAMTVAAASLSVIAGLINEVQRKLNQVQQGLTRLTILAAFAGATAAFGAAIAKATISGLTAAGSAGQTVSFARETKAIATLGEAPTMAPLNQRLREATDNLDAHARGTLTPVGTGVTPPVVPTRVELQEACTRASRELSGEQERLMADIRSRQSTLSSASLLSQNASTVGAQLGEGTGNADATRAQAAEKTADSARNGTDKAVQGNEKPVDALMTIRYFDGRTSISRPT